jgi:hypothetical protein
MDSNIKMNRTKIVCDGVEWINVAHDFCESFQQVEAQNLIDLPSNVVLRLIFYTLNLS